MKKVKCIMIVLLSVLLAGCANSNSAEEPIEAGNPIEQNINQTDKEEENDKQHDSQTDLIPNNDLPYGLPVDFDTSGLSDAFVSAINEYCRTGIFPDGRSGGDIPGIIFYAVYDVDGDGEDELILKNEGTDMASMTERVYAYENGVFRTEYFGFPALTYYDNGIVQEEWSHNQGKAGDKFWPYTLYQYNADDDNYIELGAVDAWDRELADFISDYGAFPDDIDTDGDGYIYLLLSFDYISQRYNTDIVDGPDYEKWRNQYLDGAEALEIPYRKLAVEKVFPNAAG